MNEPTKQLPTSDSYDHTTRSVTRTGKLSLAVTLPRIHCRELNIEAGTLVTVKKMQRGFLITKK